MCLFFSRIIIIFLIIFVFVSTSSLAYEIKSKYTTISYESEEQLQKFNKKIRLGRLSYLLKDKKSITYKDEIKNKVDVLVERVETILEMFPNEVNFKIALLSSDDEVQTIFKEKYERTVDYIAFYSPKDKTIFLSVEDIDIGVLAHEFAHVILDMYYGIPTPSKLHEILAQYVETHLQD